MNVQVTILGRATVCGAFAKLWETTVDVAKGVTTLVTPVIDPVNRGDELFMEVQPPRGTSVNYATFRHVLPAEADASGAPQRVIASNVFSGEAGKVRRVPFSGSMIGISRTGTRPSA